MRAFHREPAQHVKPSPLSPARNCPPPNAAVISIFPFVFEAQRSARWFLLIGFHPLRRILLSSRQILMVLRHPLRRSEGAEVCLSLRPLCLSRGLGVIAPALAILPEHSRSASLPCNCQRSARPSTIYLLR